MKRKFVPVLLVLLLFAACAKTTSQQIVQQSDKLVPQATTDWFAIEQEAITLHASGLLTGTQWNTVVDIRNKISPKIQNMWQIWLRIHSVDQAVQDADFIALMAEITGMIADVTKIIHSAEAAAPKKMSQLQTGCSNDPAWLDAVPSHGGVR